MLKDGLGPWSSGIRGISSVDDNSRHGDHTVDDGNPALPRK